MDEPKWNRCVTSDLVEADVDAALGRIGARDADLAKEAEGIYRSLTWGEGPGMISLSSLQQWLWYVLPMKYFTNEVGYKARLAAAVAELFDELGLHWYASVCRSDTTAKVHSAYDKSDSAGKAAMRKAMDASGVKPPDVDGFSWGSIQGMAEATAGSAVEDALEKAIAAGDLVVGGRGWRTKQREIVNTTLDRDHPVEPGQSWRTTVETERVQNWLENGVRRSPSLRKLRAGVVNHLLGPIDPPDDVASVMAPIVEFLDLFGDERPLTQAGYLKPAFVQEVYMRAGWQDPFVPRRPPRTEYDAILLGQLREMLQETKALRKVKKVLKRTAVGASAAVDPVAAWNLIVGYEFGDPWNEFVVETAGLVMIDHGGEMASDQLFSTVAVIASEMGWSTSSGGVAEPPPEREISRAFYHHVHLMELAQVLERSGDLGDRHFALTDVGVTAMLAKLRRSAAGPKTQF